SLMSPRPPRPTLVPYTTLFRSQTAPVVDRKTADPRAGVPPDLALAEARPSIARVEQKPEQIPGRHPEEVRRKRRRLGRPRPRHRSEEHTSELQSRSELVCRLLL